MSAKQNPLAGEPEGKNKTGQNLILRDVGIVPQTAALDKPRPYRQPTKNQINALMYLRRRIGLDRWNRTKRELGITAPGVWELTFDEAYLLIGTITKQLNNGGAK